jgi:hypothetical protein
MLPPSHEMMTVAEIAAWSCTKYTLLETHMLFRAGFVMVI